MTSKLVKIVLLVAAIAAMTVFAISASAAPPAAPSAQGDPQRGAYIFSLNGGCGCHMGQAGFLAGGEKFEGPFGVVYASNITPDAETGIGDWTDQQIIDAIRLGETPDGEQLFPVMPYPYFSGVADQDVQDLVAFLRTAEPIQNTVPDRALEVPVPPFEPPQEPPAVAPMEGVDRGAYLVNTISHCGDCHTPKNPDGSPIMAEFLAGGFIEGEIAPNITPHAETGIGGWTEDQIATFLQTGTRPDGSQAGGLMDLVIQGGFKDMTDSDAMAIAAYLKTVPAVENVAQPPEQMPTTGGALAQGWIWMLVAGLVAMLGVLLALTGVIWRFSTRRIDR